MGDVMLYESMMVHPHGTSLNEAAGENLMAYTILEGGGDTGRLKIKLPVTFLDKINENKRIYATSMMQRAINEAKDDFDARTLLCTVDEHPKEQRPPPGQSSHVVTRAWIESGVLWNEWEILETHNGKNLAALVEGRCSFGVSIRGKGSQDKKGNIKEGYRYFGTDCVGNPSAKLWTGPTLPTSQSNLNLTTNESIQEGTEMKLNTLAEALGYVDSNITEMSKMGFSAAIARQIQVDAILESAELPARDMKAVLEQWDAKKESVTNKLLANVNKLATTMGANENLMTPAPAAQLVSAPPAPAVDPAVAAAPVAPKDPTATLTAMGIDPTIAQQFMASITQMPTPDNFSNLCKSMNLTDTQASDLAAALLDAGITLGVPTDQPKVIAAMGESIKSLRATVIGTTRQRDLAVETIEGLSTAFVALRAQLNETKNKLRVAEATVSELVTELTEACKASATTVVESAAATTEKPLNENASDTSGATIVKVPDGKSRTERKPRFDTGGFEGVTARPLSEANKSGEVKNPNFI